MTLPGAPQTGEQDRFRSYPARTRTISSRAELRRCHIDDISRNYDIGHLGPGRSGVHRLAMALLNDEALPRRCLRMAM